MIDFGTAKQMNWKKNAKYTNAIGTQYFRAPELLRGSTSYNYSVDVWPLGCIFYQLLVREVLFKAKTET